MTSHALQVDLMAADYCGTRTAQNAVGSADLLAEDLERQIAGR